MKENENREAIGIKLSIFGIIMNIILFGIKLLAGIFSNSTAILGEAFNNLLDSISFIISIIGFKFSKKPNNHYYPFGYGRVEYISGLIISILTILVGVELVKVSITKLFVADQMIFNKFVILVLVASILSKLIIGLYSRVIGKKIDSLTIIALSEDSFSDMLISIATLLSYLLSYYFKVNLDGIMGLVVSLVIIRSGIKTMLEISKPLIGNRKNTDLHEKIKAIIKSNENIQSVHDLQIHNYGENRLYCSACVVVENDMLLSKILPQIEDIQEKISNEFDHMDTQIGIKLKNREE